MRSRAEALDFALLGLLSQGALHGYELRKRIIAMYGPFRALSFSVLYPQLHKMVRAGLIEQSLQSSSGLGKRSRIIYESTEKGRERFDLMTSSTSSDNWDDESFEVRFAFFGPTPPVKRLQILEGRYRRLAEKADLLREEVEKSPIGFDKYLLEWRRHSLESAEREVVWLEQMIKNEKEA